MYDLLDQYILSAEFINGGIMPRYLYTFNCGSTVFIGQVAIIGDGILKDGTPIEDYGNYLLTTTKLNNEAAFFMYLANI